MNNEAVERNYDALRSFWIEHVKRCREISAPFGLRQGVRLSDSWLERVRDYEFRVLALRT